MKYLITILLIVSFGTIHAQFVNTTSIGSKSTLYKSLGGLSADSAILVLNSFPDTTTANYSVVHLYNSIIRIGSSYWYRLLSPNKWVQLTTGASGAYVSISDTSAMLSPYQKSFSAVKYGDTASMLASRPTLTYFTSNLALKLNSSDSTIANRVTSDRLFLNASLPYKLDIFDSTLANRITADRVFLNSSLPLKINVSDTSAMLSTYPNNTSLTSQLALKQNSLILTTTGTSGAATLVGATLNVPNYASGSGTVTSISALTLGTTGTDLSSSVANSTTTPVITLNVPTASATNRGVLSTTDWTTFNNKQSTLTFNNGLTNTAGTVGLGGILTSNAVISASGYQLSLDGGTTVALNNNNMPIRSTSYLTASGTETIQLATAGVYGGLHIDLASGSFTPFSTSKHAALSGTVYKTSTGNFTGILPAVFGTVELSGTGNITTAVAIRAFRPELTALATYTGTITNAVGVYIDDISASSVVGQITNKYAIYQVGSTDINLFSGKVMMTGLPVYADNTAAASLPTGQVYRTATGQLQVKY